MVFHYKPWFSIINPSNLPEKNGQNHPTIPRSEDVEQKISDATEARLVQLRRAEMRWLGTTSWGFAKNAGIYMDVYGKPWNIVDS